MVAKVDPSIATSMESLFNRMNKEVAAYTFSYLSLAELASATQVSTYFQDIISSPFLFKTKANQIGITVSEDPFVNYYNLSKLGIIRCFVAIQEHAEFEPYIQGIFSSIHNGLPVPLAPTRLVTFNKTDKIDPIFKKYVTSLQKDKS